MHSPACLTWQRHVRRCLTENATYPTLQSFLDDVLHAWEQELLMDDPEFFIDLDRMIAETRAEMDAVA